MRRDLEIRHCRALVAVNDAGGVGAAARVLGVAQSTVSETLLSLERLLGAPVTLRRAGREAALTAAATAILPHARSLIAGSEAALAAGATQSAVAVRLGTVESISSFLLPGPLRDIRQLWPRTDVRVTIGLCDDLRKCVAVGDLDAALTLEESSGDALSELAPVALRLVASPDHPLARAVATKPALNMQTFLLSDSEGAFNKLIRAWVGNRDGGARFESAGSVEGVKRGVLSGDAIGLLPDYAVREQLSDGSLVAIRCADTPPLVSLRITTVRPLDRASPLSSLIAKTRDVLDGLDPATI